MQWFMLVLEQCFEVHGMIKRASSPHVERQAGNVHCAPALRQCLAVELKPIHRHSLECFWGWSGILMLLPCAGPQGPTDAQSQLTSGEAAPGAASRSGGCWTAASAMT